VLRSFEKLTVRLARRNTRQAFDELVRCGRARNQAKDFHGQFDLPSASRDFLRDNAVLAFDSASLECQAFATHTGKAPEGQPAASKCFFKPCEAVVHFSTANVPVGRPGLTTACVGSERMGPPPPWSGPPPFIRRDAGTMLCVHFVLRFSPPTFALLFRFRFVLIFLVLLTIKKRRGRDRI
jgi:hypothetical protein